MRRSLRITLIALVSLTIVGGGFGFWLYNASQQVPEFYRDAIAQDQRLQQKASNQLLQRATALASDAHKQGRWQALFTAEQINGWLAIDLPGNYPDLLPPEIHEPRVAINKDSATVACRYDNGDVSTVFSLTFDVYLNEPNVIAIRIRNARAGALPVPLKTVLDAVSQAVQGLELPLEWRQKGGDPVALVTISPSRADQKNPLELDTIELRHGELFLAGHKGTVEQPQYTARPEASSEARAESAADQAPVIGAGKKLSRQR